MDTSGRYRDQGQLCKLGRPAIGLTRASCTPSRSTALLPPFPGCCTPCLHAASLSRQLPTPDRLPFTPRCMTSTLHTMEAAGATLLPGGDLLFEPQRGVSPFALLQPPQAVCVTSPCHKPCAAARHSKLPPCRPANARAFAGVGRIVAALFSYTRSARRFTRRRPGDPLGVAAARIGGAIERGVSVGCRRRLTAQSAERVSWWLVLLRLPQVASAGQQGDRQGLRHIGYR